ncbi:MAG: ATP-grasp domain-containing protein [Candidatus Omnitrophica bacterium]|nr:ATP-grasp domain-containing protein [Candidatus Omnitrophota bacterium]
MKKRLKVLQIFNTPYAVLRGYDFKEEFSDKENMYTENDVYRALQANGYEVRLLGLFDRIEPLLEEVRDFQPDVIFNMVEVFKDNSRLEHHVGALLELLGVPYTGASSEELFLCNNKAICKKILRFHRLRVPRFQTFYRRHKVRRPQTIKLPAVIKPLCEEASRGISQASVVDSDQAFVERIKFIHENMNMDAIAEEYIDGRELYVSVLGSNRLTVLPAREMKFGEMSEDEPRIATYKAKWDDNYRDRWGIKSMFATKLPDGVDEHIVDVCKRAYRALELKSYVRFDIRLTPTGQVYIIEPNANPCLAQIDELSQSAEKVGISYPQLIRKIVMMALDGQSQKKK